LPITIPRRIIDKRESQTKRDWNPRRFLQS
jgi:hypothetical protein